jgi:hypothetical protein
MKRPYVYFIPYVSLLIVALVAGCALAAFAAGMTSEDAPVFRFDFGDGPAAKGYTKVTGTTFGPEYSYLWRGEGVGDRDRATDDPLTRDFVFASDAEFVIGLDNGTYRVRMVLGDADFAHGPFDVFVDDKRVVERVETRKGEFEVRQFEARVENQRLSIHFRPVDAPNFAIAAMEILGPPQKKIHSAVGSVPSKDIPTADEIDALGQPDARAALRKLCDWLVAHQTKTGIWSGAWYRTSYPVRTLLAGYDIFGEQRYLDTATKCLDKLLTEQLPNNSFSASIRNRPTSQLSPAVVEQIMAGTTNTADVGCITACLSIAAPYVDAERRKLYLDTAKRYADGYAAQWQLDSGGFTNAQCAGIRCTTEYSVATGTQAMNFAALYAATGQQRYLTTATRAAEFLLRNWLEDGRPIHHRWNSPEKGPAPITDFGNSYYYHDGIMWVYHHNPEPAFRETVQRVYGWHIFAQSGLLQARENGVWWPMGHPWTNAKATAMPCVFMLYSNHVRKVASLETAIGRAITFLSTPQLQQKVGIMVEPDLPWGTYSMQSTGFAGLSLAEHVCPGVVFLKSDRAQRKPAGTKNKGP